MAVIWSLPGQSGSSVIKVFDMTAATTGINETNAQKSGLEVDTVIPFPPMVSCRIIILVVEK